MILHRSSTEDVLEILWRPFLRDPGVMTLQMPHLEGACMKALVEVFGELLLSRSCKIRSSSTAAAGPFMTIFANFSSESWHEDLAQKVFYNSFCEDLVAEVLVSRSCGDFDESSSGGPCSKILKIHEDPLPRCLYESSTGMLVGSSCKKIF